MRSTSRQLTVAMMVGLLILIWNARTDRDAAVAQGRRPILVTHLFTGKDGRTHAETIEVKLTPGAGTALGGSANESSEAVKVKELTFRRSAPNMVEDWHHPARRQYVITLSGRGEVELESGEKVPIGPGSIFLSEDMTGKGHLTRGIGTEDRISLIIPLADQ